jgi:hypothetical protein
MNWDKCGSANTQRVASVWSRLEKAGLNPASCRERDRDTVPANHEVIEQPHIDQRQRLLQSRGDCAISGGRFATTRRMIVADDDSGSIALQGASCDFARMHLATVHGSEKQVFDRYDAVTRVQKNAGEHFLLLAREPHLEDSAGLRGVGQQFPAGDAATQDVLGGSKDVIFAHRSGVEATAVGY